MISVLYRFKIKSGKEQQFENSWKIVTEAMLKECGGLGSRLHLNEGGQYVAYAQWQNLEKRNACHFKNPDVLNAKKLMNETVESFSEEVLEIRHDFLVGKNP